MPKRSFEDRYPNISPWVNRENGIIEIGCRLNGYSSSFVRASDTRGIFCDCEDEYDSMEDALLALKDGVRELMRKIHGE